jgi:hypothetical protein
MFAFIQIIIQLEEMLKVRLDMDWIDLIKKYNPYNEQEKKDKEIMLYCIDTFDDVLNRNNEVVHIAQRL